MATVICSPDPIPCNTQIKVFLAGSIDMGMADDWQSYVVNQLEQNQLILLNPRRDDWKPEWNVNPQNPEFLRQVNWEMDAMDEANLIIMNLSKESQAPISLLELGLHAHSGKLIVFCNKDFWRYGNVFAVCDRYGIPLVKSLNELIGFVKKHLCTRTSISDL